MAFEPKVPPSLNRIWGRSSPQRKDARKLEVEKAMRSLPLTHEAKSRVLSFVSAFETTYYDVKRQKDDHPASAALVEKQLSEMVRKCDKLERHLRGMHRDAISAWASAGGSKSLTDAAVRFGALHLIVNTWAEWAEQALANNAARRAAKRGNPGDAMAAAMRETAAFVYSKLTGGRPGRAYDAYKQKERDTKFIKFLGRIYQAYGVRASARSRVRQRRRNMGNKSKK